MKVSRRSLGVAIVSLFVLACLTLLLHQGDASTDSAVGGFVFFDEQPLGNADVFFVPEETGGQTKSYIGRANNGGYYEVTGGVPAGDYRVIIRAAISNAGDSPPSLEGFVEIDDMQHFMMAEAKSNRDARLRHPRRQTKTALATLPEIYSSAAYTILRVRVPEEGMETADMYLWSDLCEVVASETPINRAIR